MQCEQVLEAVKLGEETQEIWDHLATCVSCRTKCESTSFVFDRADPTDKRPPAALADNRRRWMPFMLLFLLIPVVAGLALVALKLRHPREVVAPAVVVAPAPRPSVTPVAVPLAPARPSLRRVAIDTTPSAVLWVDGKRQGPTPFEGELPAGKIAIELKADGFHTVRKTVVVGDGEVKLAFNLQPRSSGGSSAEPAPGEALDVAPATALRALPKPPAQKKSEPTDEDEPKVAAQHADPPEPPPAPKAKPAAAPVADEDDAVPSIGGAFGFLTINCEPYAKVILDGKDIGRTTPLSRYSTAPGHHTVELRARNGSVTVEVNVKSHQAVEIDKTIE